MRTGTCLQFDKEPSFPLSHRSKILPHFNYKEDNFQDDIKCHIFHEYNFHSFSSHSTLHMSVGESKDYKVAQCISCNSTNIEVMNFLHMRNCNWDKSMYKMLPSTLLSFLPHFHTKDHYCPLSFLKI